MNQELIHYKPVNAAGIALLVLTLTCLPAARFAYAEEASGTGSMDVVIYQLSDAQKRSNSSLTESPPDTNGSQELPASTGDEHVASPASHAEGKHPALYAGELAVGESLTHVHQRELPQTGDALISVGLIGAGLLIGALALILAGIYMQKGGVTDE